MGVELGHDPVDRRLGEWAVGGERTRIGFPELEEIELPGAFGLVESTGAVVRNVAMLVAVRYFGTASPDGVRRGRGLR